MGLIYSVSVLFFAFMIFRMYLKKDIRPYMTSRVVTHNSRVVALCKYGNYNCNSRCCCC